MQSGELHNAVVAIMPIKVEGFSEARIRIVDDSQSSRAVVRRRMRHQRVDEVHIASIPCGFNESVPRHSFDDLTSPPSCWRAVPVRVFCSRYQVGRYTCSME